MPKVAIKEMHRTIGDLSKQPANIPTGVWKLRAIKLSGKDVTKTNRDGEEFETREYTLLEEPISPTASVNPDEVNQIDERTGKPVYESKRLFLRYVEAFRSDMVQLSAALASMGFTEQDDFDEIVGQRLTKNDDGTVTYETVPGPSKVRGRMHFGEIFNRTYKRNDGSDGVEQKVRSWAASEGSQTFVL